MKIRSMGAELSHADGRRDTHDEAHSRFSVLRSLAFEAQRSIMSHLLSV